MEGLPVCIYLGGLLLIVTLPGAQPGNCSVPFYHVIGPDSAEGPFFSGYSVEGSDDEYQPQGPITHPFLQTHLLFQPASPSMVLSAPIFVFVTWSISL